MTIYHVAICIIDIIALFILNCIIFKSNLIDTKFKLFLRLAILAVIIVIGAEIAVVLFENKTISFRIPHIIGNMIGFSIAPLIPLLIGCAININKRKLSILFQIPFLLNLILVLASFYIPLIFGVRPDNTYYRADFFWVFVATYSLGVAFLFLKTLQATNHYQNQNRFILYIIFLFVVIGTSFQVIVPQLRLSWLCISFGIGLYYTYFCELSYQIDGLTGLLNRRVYDRTICTSNGIKRGTVLFFDIDDFKIINDTYGHQFGDFCLMSVSSSLKDVFFKIGLCFRIGGDEFCVITKNTDQITIQKACHKFLSEIESICNADKRMPMVSVGYSFYDSKMGSMKEAIFAADQEMYRFKQKNSGSPDIYYVGQ